MSYDVGTYDGGTYDDLLAGAAEPVSARSTAVLDRARGQRRESVAYEVVGPDGLHRGWVKPTRGPRISVDTARTFARTLDSLFVSWDQAADLDTLTDRIRPSWVRENGDRSPLGEFLFGHAPMQENGRGSDLMCSMVDQSTILDQIDGKLRGCAVGQNVSDCIHDEWIASGVREFRVEFSPVVLGAPIGWPAGTPLRKRMQDLGKLIGYLDPYFDNYGVGISRSIPDLTTVTPTLRYGNLAGEYPVDRGTVVRDNDRLATPNRWVAVDTSASTTAYVGQYDLPDYIPWSAAARGLVVCAPIIRVQGGTSVAQMESIARAAAMADASLNETLVFSAPFVPLHDEWDVLGYGGDAWLERSWAGDLRAGGAIQHTARRSLAA